MLQHESSFLAPWGLAAAMRPLDMSGIKPTILGANRKAERGLHHAGTQAKGAAKAEGQAIPTADRALFLADAEWLEGLDHARRVPAALQRGPGEHRARGA